MSGGFRWLCVAAALVFACCAGEKRQQGVDGSARDESLQTPAEGSAETYDAGRGESRPERKVERKLLAGADYLAGRLPGCQLLRVWAPAIDALPRDEKVLVYHVARAVQAGRDIVFSQVHRFGLATKRLLEKISEYSSELPPELRRAIEDTLGLVWLSGGVYDVPTGVKLRLPLDYDGLVKASQIAAAVGAEIDADDEASVEEGLVRLRRPLFDPGYEPVLAGARPETGRDPLAGSHLNLYSGVRMSDLRRFEQKHPENSRLIKVEKKLIEQVYRTGDRLRRIPRGRYWRQLGRVVRRLQNALPVGSRIERRMLTSLVEGFRTGDSESFSAFCELASSHSGPVLFDLGFTDFSLDPRGVKGVFRGMVAAADAHATARARRLAGMAKKIGAMLKLEDDLMDSAMPGVVVGDVVALAGRGTRLGTTSWQVCPPAGKEGSPAKVVVFENVAEALAVAVVAKAARVFGVEWNPRENRLQYLDYVVLREAVLPQLLKRKKPRSRLAWREGRVVRHLFAEAAALLLLDGRARKAGMPAMTGMRDALLAGLLAEQVMFAADERLRHPRWLARRMLANFLSERGLLRLEATGTGSWEMSPGEPEALTSALEKLARTCARISARADRAASSRLVQRYGSIPSIARKTAKQLDQALAGEGLARLYGIVLPKLRPSFEQNRVVEVDVAYDEGFFHQMMRYRRY